MIRNWLREKIRDSNKYKFNIIDLEEIKDIDEEILNYLGKIILESYRKKEDLKRRFSSKSEEELRHYLYRQVFPNIKEFVKEKRNQPAKNVMQGDFGEILTSDVARKIKDLHVPILKMRFKFNNNKSVFCTDIFAHNLGDEITDLTYFEVKTRINNKKENEHYIAYNAAKSLIKDQESDNSEAIADFLERYYYNLGETVYEAGNEEKAGEYFSLADKYGDIVLNSEKYNKNFEVVIIMDREKYNDCILTDLNELDFTCGRLEITILLVENIKNLYLKAFDYAYDYAKKYVYN